MHVNDSLRSGGRTGHLVPWYWTDTAKLVWCFLIGMAVHLALWQVSEPPDLFSDYYKAYFPAAEVLWEEGLNAKFPFTEAGAGGFVNVPVLGWLFVPMVPLGEDAAGWTFLAIGVPATLAAYLALRRIILPDGNAAALLLLLFLVNGPLINALREGNSTHFILLLLILAFSALWRGWEFTAGLILGFAAVIKLPLLLFGGYFLFRRRWMVVAGGTAMIGAVMALSVVLFGIANNVAWADCCVVPFLGGLIPAFNVQSIDGFFMRLIVGTANLENWDPVPPPLYYRIARLFIFAGVASLCLFAMLRASRNEPAAAPREVRRPREVLEYALIITLALVVSPISWTHYYALLLLPWGLFLGGKLLPDDGPAARKLVWASIILSSLPVIVLPLQADFMGEFAARTILSAWFFGGLAMLAALLLSLYRLGGAASVPPRTAS